MTRTETNDLAYLLHLNAEKLAKVALQVAMGDPVDPDALRDVAAICEFASGKV